MTTTTYLKGNPMLVFSQEFAKIIQKKLSLKITFAIIKLGLKEHIVLILIRKAAEAIH